MDLVEIRRIQGSLDQFGERFLQRIFTARESAYAAAAPPLQAERLAARFAAKEAALKALGLAGQGVAWRDMEVFRHADGRCTLQLHDRAAALAQHNGVTQIAMSLSHDGDYAAAIVAVVTSPADA
jgi:holo-[acyl-carrier protein] synthase